MMTFLKNRKIDSMSCNYILVVQGIRSMDDIELFTTWVGLSIICAYPAEDVRESISWPEVLVISFFNQLEQRALISPVVIEHIGN